MDDDGDKLLTPAQAAERLQVHTVTLALWRQGDKGPPYVKLAGRSIRYPLAKLNEWVASQAVAP